jgi:lipopolysaccharide export system protein LptC
MQITDNSKKGSHKAYSRLVFLMKLLFPSLAAVLVGVIVVWPKLMEADKQMSLLGADVINQSVSSQITERPRFMGIDEQNQPFTISAVKAEDITPSNAAKQEQRVRLSTVRADITTSEGMWISLEAIEGIFDQADNMVELRNDVVVVQDQGYEVQTDQAFVDLNAGHAYGSLPVDGHGPFGHIESEGFDLRDKGKDITFTGKVFLKAYPAQDKLSQSTVSGIGADVSSADAPAGAPQPYQPLGVPQTVGTDS